VAAYGACRVPRVSVVHVRRQIPFEREEMDFAGLADEPVARYPHNPVYADPRSGQPSAAGDQREADYLLHLLSQGLRRIDDRIERYKRLTAIFEAGDNVDYARTFGRLRLLEDDRQILEGLIDDLLRRFPPRAPS
jgi:hypothetical protein